MKLVGCRVLNREIKAVCAGIQCCAERCIDTNAPLGENGGDRPGTHL